MNIPALFQLLRPRQWLKNLLLYFPPYLGGVLAQPGMFEKGIVAFICFSMGSSCTYIINDLADISRDALHPRKRLRPLPSGNVTPRTAAVLASLLGAASLLGLLAISGRLAASLLLYIAVSLSYSFFFKDIPVADIFCISAGFVVRLYAGAFAFDIEISEWLFLSVFLLALFLSTGKRFSEKKDLAERAGDHRLALSLYPPGFLEATMILTGSSVLVTYTMYVISRHTLIYTVPLCAFGLLRYLFRVQAGGNGDPTDSLLRDPPLLVVSILWAIMVGLGIYGG